MTCLSKIKLLVATVVTACAFTLPLAGDAWASAFNNYHGKNLRDCYHISKLQENLNLLKNEKFEHATNKQEMLALKSKYVSQMQTMIDTCSKLKKSFPNIFANAENFASDQDAIKSIFGKENALIGKDKYTNEEIHDLYARYLYKQINASNNKNYGNSLLKTFADNNAQVDQTYLDIQTKYQGSRCGNNYPFGCPAKQKCYECSGSRGSQYNVEIYTDYSCGTSAPSVGTSGTEKCIEVPTSGNEGTNWSNYSGGRGHQVNTEATGKSTQTTTLLGKKVEELDTSITGENTYTDYRETARSNAGYCDINALKSDYMSNCYSCVVVGNLIKTFMSISAITYPVAQEAGVKLLVIGMMIWLAFYVLKKLSSFVSLEPMKMLQELFSFFFKCLIAYVLMTSGLRNITDLIVDPILKAGADYGISIIDSVSKDLLKKTEIVERTKEDAPYQAEPVKDKEQAKKVEEENKVKVTGEVHTGKYRPEDISKTKESGMNYCCWGDKRKNGYHAFGAHQLDFFAGGAEEFAKRCEKTNKEIYNAYVSAGKKSGTSLRSALTPIFKRMCSTASGQAELKKLQDDYYISQYKYVLKYASDTLGINLNMNNYAQDSNFTLSAALISGQIHNPGAIKRVIKGIKAKSGSCASRSCNMDALAKQVYAGLKSELGFTKRYGTGDGSELNLCQRVLNGGDIDSSGLSSSGSSGYASYDYRQTDHYYIVKKGDQDFDLIPINKEDNKAVLDTTVFEKIMLISRKADNAVSLNFVIGDALVCHSTHAGAIQFAKKVTDLIGLEFYFPDVWIWLCGAVIWVFALMVTLAVNFYLLDLSFKIGFALLALPITIGLWPFEKFKDKFKVCVDIIINAAGTFMFLGITTGLSVLLISSSLGGTEELFSAIENDRKEYISNTFSLAGAKFFLILFAFLYSHKMISETVSKMANKFFPSVTNGLTPMHHMTTQAIDMGVNAAKTVASGVAGAVTGGATTAAKAVAKTAARQAVKGIRKGISKGGSGVKKLLGGK